MNWMTCQPNVDRTGGRIWPGRRFGLKIAFAKAASMALSGVYHGCLPPVCLAEASSDIVRAIWSNLSGSTSRVLYAATASSWAFCQAGSVAATFEAFVGSLFGENRMCRTRTPFGRH